MDRGRMTNISFSVIYAYYAPIMCLICFNVRTWRHVDPQQCHAIDMCEKPSQHPFLAPGVVLHWTHHHFLMKSLVCRAVEIRTAPEVRHEVTKLSAINDVKMKCLEWPFQPITYITCSAGTSGLSGY